MSQAVFQGAVVMRVSGSTKLVPIIGHPVTEVVSPPMFNAHFQSIGLDWVMVPLDVPEKTLKAFWQILRASLNMVGCSVTYPHKQNAFDVVDQHSPRAKRLGALNTVRVQSGKLFGDATDGQAMCRAIEEKGQQITDRTASVLGAGGGAGIAIVDALCENGIRHLVLHDTHPQRLAALKNFMKNHWPDVAVDFSVSPADIVINATTLGKNASDPCPFNNDMVSASQIVCDVIGRSGNTELNQRTLAAGLPFVSGEDMGRCQLDAQLAFWRS